MTTDYPVVLAKAIVPWVDQSGDESFLNLGFNRHLPTDTRPPMHEDGFPLSFIVPTGVCVAGNRAELLELIERLKIVVEMMPQ
jgi:hypothetical protein